MSIKKGGKFHPDRKYKHTSQASGKRGFKSSSQNKHKRRASKLYKGQGR